nr:AAA family ATPase [Chloroflexota bacterium]
MILVELQIENYKHFLGSHAISVPSEGIVGVIGANGAGKTTLFEAIEWCLYNPAHIASKDVPPRLGLGQSRVQ